MSGSAKWWPIYPLNYNVTAGHTVSALSAFIGV